MNYPLPDGNCWCGCGNQTRRGKYFLTGHDRRAEGQLMRMHYGEVAGLLWAHGYGPTKLNIAETYKDWQEGNNND